MVAKIKIHRDVMNQIIEHSSKYDTFECGGYLIGNIIKNYDEIIFNILAVYSDDNIGKNNRYNFFDIIEKQVDEYSKRYLGNKRVIGNYHSHGEYPAIFSKEDLEMVKNNSKDYCHIIYSPIHQELSGMIYSRSLGVLKASISFFGEKKELMNQVNIRR